MAFYVGKRNTRRRYKTHPLRPQKEAGTIFTLTRDQLGHLAYCGNEMGNRIMIVHCHQNLLMAPIGNPEGAFFSILTLFEVIPDEDDLVIQ